jgi:adenylate kinase
VQAIRKRIELFHELTEPVIDYYRDMGKLIQVDGEKDVHEVFESFMKEIRNNK